MKRNISDLLDGCEVEALELGESAPLSSARIKELTMSKITKKQKKSGRIAFRVLVAAAILAALSMSVLAAEEILTSDNWFRDYFSGKEVVAQISENQIALLDAGMTEVNQSVTSNGYTVTMQSAITDGYVVYLVFRVDAPEGTVLDGVYYNFEEIPMDLFGESIDDGVVSVASGGWRCLEDDDPADNSIMLLLEMSFSDTSCYSESFADGKDRTISLRTLHESRKNDAGEVERAVLAEGEWDFTFRFSDSSAMTAEAEMLSEPVRTSGRRMLRNHYFAVNMKVTSFKLRALTATMVVERPLTGFWEGVLLDPIYIVMKNGSRVQIHLSSGGTVEGGFSFVFDFDQPISFRDVDYVEFSGGDKVYMPDADE